MLPEYLRNKIIENLRPINPYTVILFGSYAYGTPDKDSDIDLLVVTREDFIPRSFGENIEHYLKVASLLSDVKREYPVDLTVYTRPMYEKFISLGSMFAKKIISKGIVLYEGDK